MFPPETSEEDVATAIGLSHEVTLEDIQVVEAIQVSMESGLYEPGPLSPSMNTVSKPFKHGLESVYS